MTPQTDRYTPRIFDPTIGPGATLHSVFDGSKPASTIALTVEERDFFDNADHRATRSLMHQRTGPCG